LNHRRQGTLNRPFVSFPPQLRQQAADLNSPPTSNESKVYSLSQVARSIRLALERATANKSWLVRAEIVSISGNLGERTVYLDLVEESEGRQNAKMRGIIWAANGKRILEELGPEAGQVLQAGSEVVFSARIQFHERYGVSLHIDKIELRFMLGELERRKQATIERLKKEGVLDLNRRIPVTSKSRPCWLPWHQWFPRLYHQITRSFTGVPHPNRSVSIQRSGADGCRRIGPGHRPSNRFTS
jgi:hypothetical protein